MARTLLSAKPPGENGTTMRTGFAGQVWAWAVARPPMPSANVRASAKTGLLRIGYLLFDDGMCFGSGRIFL